MTNVDELIYIYCLIITAQFICDWLLFSSVKINLVLTLQKLGSSITIPMGYKLDGCGLIPSKGKRFFCTPQHLDWFWGSRRLLCNGYWGSLPRGIRLLGHECDTLPSIAKVKNTGYCIAASCCTVHYNFTTLTSTSLQLCPYIKINTLKSFCLLLFI
jgi:hypothetical protein